MLGSWTLQTFVFLIIFKTVVLTCSLVQECIAALSTKFTDSPRLQCLVGIRKEASEPVESVLKYYDGLLEEDESNAVRDSALNRVPVL